MVGAMFDIAGKIAGSREVDVKFYEFGEQLKLNLDGDTLSEDSLNKPCDMIVVKVPPVSPG